MSQTYKYMDHFAIDGKPWNYGLLQYQSILINDEPPSPMGVLFERQPMGSFSTFPGMKICPVSKNTYEKRLNGSLPFTLDQTYVDV